METTSPAVPAEAQERARKVHRLATTGATAGERIAAWVRLTDMSVAAHLPLPDFLAACGLALTGDAKDAGGPVQ